MGDIGGIVLLLVAAAVAVWVAAAAYRAGDRAMAALLSRRPSR